MYILYIRSTMRAKKDEYALVTGASSGLGFEFSKILANEGYPLLLVSNDEEGLQHSVEKIQSEFNTNVIAHCLDLSHDDSAQRVFDYCEENELSIEVLINNAGFFFFGMATDADTEKAKSMIDLHVKTTSVLCTLFGAKMKERGRGYILNNSSISAYKHFPGIAYYGSTKAYIKSFTQSLRLELKPYGIHVTCLLPGATATNLYDPNVVNVERAKKLGIMLDPSFVARKGLRALFNNRSRSVPGVTTKIMNVFARMTPYWIIYILRKKSSFLKD